MKIEKEFIPYEQALALKELGFDEPCIAFYSPKKELYPVMQQPGKGPYFNNGNFIETIRAPLYQQAFDFFEEKYNLSGETQKQATYEKVTNPYWWYTIQDVRGNDLSNWQDRFGEILNKSHQDKKEKYIDDDEFVKFLYNDKFAFKTRLEAKIECLNRLIEIVKQIK